MGYYPQESLYKPYKYHGYAVRGTPNCPLNYVSFREGSWCVQPDESIVNRFESSPKTIFEAT